MRLLTVLFLAGCTRIVYVDKPVEIPVPIVKPLPAVLVADCPPDYRIPDHELTVRQAVARLHSVEAALAACRARMAQIRAGQTH